MSLEDVDFMIQNSEKDSLVMFIDSSTRNKHFYPSAAHYVIELSQPLRNVYGFEVLDLAVPSTMWNIDKYNNTFAFSQLFFQNTYDVNTFTEWFLELQHNKDFEFLWNGLFAAEIFICVDESNYEYIKSNVQTVTSAHNGVFLRHVVHEHSIQPYVFDMEDKDGTQHVFTYNGKKYRISKKDVLFPIIKSENFVMKSDNTIVYYTMFYTNAKGATSVIGMIKSESESNMFRYDMYISNSYIEIEHGNYDIITLQQYMVSRLVEHANTKKSAVLTDTHIQTSQSASKGGLKKQLKLVFSFQGVYPFVFDMKKSTARDAFGFSLFASEQVGENKQYIKLHHKNNEQLFMSVANLATDSSISSDIPFTQKLDPPGLVNLVGERFILLRIPEIEQHVALSHSYGNNYPGIALIKLAPSSEMTHLRFDYVSLVKKPFHPIGKLSKLTFRLETSNGYEYDFKGFDHHFMIMIKFYAPKTVARPAFSSLNPNYHPNLLEYMYSHKNEDTSDSEDLDRDALKKIIEEENQYAYSSDEDSDDEESFQK